MAQAFDDKFKGHNGCPECDDALDRGSRAAIAAVLDWLQEPGRAAEQAGESHAYGAEECESWEKSPAEVWAAMLAVKRAEALCATPRADP